MFIRADKIHNGHRWLAEGTVVELNSDGQIIALHAAHQIDSAKVMHYDGIICPGFVNAHCHLELSHLKNVIPQHTGLISFLQSVVSQRSALSPLQKTEAQETALQEMRNNGIVAVGDIANTTDTMALRTKDLMHFYTFVESIGFLPERATNSFTQAEQIWGQFAQQISHQKRLQQSIVPHAPYSVSGDLFTLIAAHQAGSTISIHNQESAEEDLLYRNKSGAFVDFLSTMGLNLNAFVATGKSSIQSYASYFLATQPILLVHNTFTSAADIHYIDQHFTQSFWCLCPNANLYIENRLPDLQSLVSAGVKLCIGTDSLASNHQLCVYSELLSIQQHYPDLDLELLLQWATYNGACALQMQDYIGSIEVGKQPGIVWIQPNNQIQKIA